MLPIASFSANAGTAGAQCGRFSDEAKHIENCLLDAASGATTLNAPWAFSVDAAQRMN